MTAIAGTPTGRNSYDKVIRGIGLLGSARFPAVAAASTRTCTGPLTASPTRRSTAPTCLN
jgi:hypothetical protein